MSYNPYARYRYGGELYHGRKKISEGGARNGYSNTPGYTAKGRKAQGRIIGYQNGHPIYEYTDTGTGYADPRSTAGKQRTLLGRVGLLAGRVGSTVSRAAGNVGRTVSGAANQAVKTAKKTAKNAYNAVGNAWDGKAGYGSAKDDAKVWKKMLDEGTKTRTVIDGRTGKTIAKQNVQNEFNKHKSAYDRSIKGRLESAGRAISGASRSAGNWLTGRANDVGKAARNVGRAIDKAWDGKAGKGSAKDDATAYNRYANDLRALQSGSRSLKTRQAYVRAANRASSAYDNSIKGRLESAGRSISNAAGNAGNWLNERRRDLETAWDGKAGKGSAKDDAYEYFRQGQDGTDQEGFREMDRYNRSIKGRLENAGKAVSKAARGASKFVSDRANDVGTAARGAANAVGGAARNAAGAVGGAANRVRRAAEEAWDGKAGKGSARDMAEKFNGPAKNEYNRKYDRSIKGTAERVGKAIGGVAGKARDTVGSTAKSVSKKAGGHMKEAGEFVSTIAKNASSAIDTATKPTREKINKALSNKDEKERMVYLGSFYDADTGHWQSEEAKQNYEKAKRDYERNLITRAGKVSKQAKQRVTQILDDAKTAGSDAIGKISSVYSSVESYINRLTKGKK